MKRINKLLLAAALTISGLGSAYADTLPRVSTYVAMDDGAPGVFTDTWTLPTSAPGVAGTSFDDGYAFNVIDTPYVSVSLSSLLPGVDFTGGAASGYALYYYQDYTYYSDTVAPLYTGLAASSSALNVGGFVLTSGEYVLEVAGTYTIDGGTYGGKIIGSVSAVPEPSAVLLLLMGLATMAGAMRLRRRQQ